MLNKQQEDAFQAIFESHNLALLGQAGTGKSFVIKEAVKQLKFIEKNVALLCSTGIGCLQYSDLGATTVHSWAGLYDGRYDDLTLKDLLLHDEKYQNVRENVKKCDTIIIDEISMLSKKDFEQLEMVCRVSKGTDELFGGMQIVAVGDFYQLPPVPNAQYKDSGKYCFLSSIWPKVFKHKIVLEQIVRQSEHKLIKAVRETGTGIVSEETEQFLEALSGDIPEESGTTVHLFSKNIEAAIYNEKKLNEIPGEEKVFVAPKNNGPQKQLNRILAPKYLRLKKGCYVMLLRNLGGKLMNGVRGYVREIRDDEIVVYFNDIKETHVIKRHMFTVFDITRKVTVAERLQFPLQLAYGITIHKSQGMTLDSVIVHCENIFQAGQLSVAIGRATSTDGLQLIGYRKGLIKVPDECVQQFYQSIGMPFMEQPCDYCVKQSYIDDRDDEGQVPNTIDDNEYDSDFDEAALDELETIDVATLPLLPDYISIKDLIDDIRTKKPITHKQKEINDVCDSLVEPFVEIFLSKHIEKIERLLPEDIEETCTTNQLWTHTLSEYHRYMLTEDYITTIPLLYEYKTSLNDIQRYIASKLVYNLLKSIVHHHAERVKSTIHPINPNPHHKGKISESGKAKIRYVGGMCISKTKNHFANLIKNNLGNPEKKAIAVVEECRKKCEVLQTMEAKPEEIDINDKSFEEIERRQNYTRCLTYINNDCFDFFLKLQDKIDRKLQQEHLITEKQTLFEICQKCLIDDTDLRFLWKNMCSLKVPENLSQSVYEKVIHLYLKVCFKQFLKNTKDNLQLLKKKRHREQITKKKNVDTNVSLKQIIEDKSEGKEVSHLRLKLNCIENKKFFNTKMFTKNDIYKLCSAYDCQFSKSMKKETLSQILADSVTSVQHMKNPEEVTQPVPSTSKDYCEQPITKKRRISKTPYKGTGRGKGKSCRKIYHCGVCKHEYQINEEWIECSNCKLWFHRECATITDEKEWNRLQEDDVEWFCDSCTNL